MRLFQVIKLVSTCVIALGVFSGSASAKTELSDPVRAPMTLFEAQEIDFGHAPASAVNVREDAQRDAAISFGARSGLARQTYEIRRSLGNHHMSLSRTFDFRRLLIPGPSGMMIEPPIVTEALHNTLINGDGQVAAVSDRVLSILRNARIVTAPRDWHQYLERSWGDVELPPQVLLPRNNDERTKWRQWVAIGWDMGVQQADEIFQLDLDRMTRDFSGMVRYRELLAQGMISEPYAMYEDRGITGDGNQLLIGDRTVKITGPAELEARPERWIPLPR